MSVFDLIYAHWNEWARIPTETLQNLMESFSRRVETAIVAKGRPTSCCIRVWKQCIYSPCWSNGQGSNYFCLCCSNSWMYTWREEYSSVFREGTFVGGKQRRPNLGAYSSCTHASYDGSDLQSSVSSLVIFCECNDNFSSSSHQVCCIFCFYLTEGFVSFKPQHQTCTYRLCFYSVEGSWCTFFHVVFTQLFSNGISEWKNI